MNGLTLCRTGRANGALGRIGSEMTPIMPSTWIVFITIPSSMGSSPRSVIGRI